MAVAGSGSLLVGNMEHGTIGAGTGASLSASGALLVVRNSLQTGLASNSGNGSGVICEIGGTANVSNTAKGALVVAFPTSVAATNTGNNSFLLGPGACTETNTLQIGILGAGIRLRGITTAFGTPTNGDIRQDSGGTVTIHSFGRERNISFLEQGLSTQVNTVSSAPTITTEQDLHSYTIPANTLAVAGDCIVVRATWKIPANARMKTVRLRFGTSGVAVYTGGPAAITGATIHVVYTIYRVTATTQKTVVDYTDSTGLTGTNIVYDDTQVEDLATALVLKTTGQIAGVPVAGDITSVLFHVSMKENS
jgi:hypothetical protein